MVKRILVNVSGTKLTDEERKNLRAHQPLGVVLFAENIDTYEQVKELIKDIKSTLDHDLVCIVINLSDQELCNRLDNIQGTCDFKKHNNMWRASADEDSSITYEKFYEQSEKIADIISDLGINMVYGFNKDEYHNTYCYDTKSQQCSVESLAESRYCLTEPLSVTKSKVDDIFLINNPELYNTFQNILIGGCNNTVTVLKCRIIAKTMEDRNINCIIDSVPNPSRRANPSRRDDKNNKELAPVVQSGWAEKYAMVSDACYKEDAVSFMPQAKILISCKELNLDDQDVRCAYKMMRNAFASGVDVCFFIVNLDKGFSLFNFLAEVENAYRDKLSNEVTKQTEEITKIYQDTLQEFGMGLLAIVENKHDSEVVAHAEESKFSEFEEFAFDLLSAGSEGIYKGLDDDAEQARHRLDCAESHPESQSIKSMPDVDATLQEKILKSFSPSDIQEKILKSFSPFSTTITQANARDFSPPSSFVAHDSVAEASGYSFDKWK